MLNIYNNVFLYLCGIKTEWLRLLLRYKKGNIFIFFCVMVKKIFLAASMMLAVSSSYAQRPGLVMPELTAEQKAMSATTSDDMKEWMSYLCSDELRGRLTGDIGLLRLPTMLLTSSSLGAWSQVVTMALTSRLSIILTLSLQALRVISSSICL